VRTFLKLEPNPREKKAASFVGYSSSGQGKQASKQASIQGQKADPKAMRLKDRV
jgi:hypothetical protein